jgi:hypothetical protein
MASLIIEYIKCINYPLHFLENMTKTNQKKKKTKKPNQKKQKKQQQTK